MLNCGDLKSAMKVLSVFVLACLSVAWAQKPAGSPPPPAPLPNLPGDTVIAVFEDGGKMTMDEFRNLAGSLPPENTRNREDFLHQYALMRKLALLAEKDGLDQQSPWKELLLYQRLFQLAQTKMTLTVTTMSVEPAEIEKFYADNKDKFKQVKVKALYVAFGGDAEGKKAVSEAQAKEKATKLLAQIRGGADFVKLVKQYSDDETSKAKDGDFATIHPGDNIPDAMRKAVFGLKQGEVTEPVGQPNGFYLFRADEVTVRPLAEVRDQIFAELKNRRMKQWMDDLDQGAKVEYPNPEFLGKPADPAAAPGK
jgi:peptidyl-prolyl cis-trans isomerase C